MRFFFAITATHTTKSCATPTCPLRGAERRKRSLGTLSTRSALRFCFGQPQPSYHTEPLIRIPSAEVSAVARSIAEDGAARYIGLCLSFAKFLSK